MLCSSDGKHSMESNVFDRLTTLYGEDMMIDAMINGPEKLEELMNKDNLFYTEFREKLNVIYESDLKLSTESLSKSNEEVENYKKNIMDSYNDLDQQLDNIMLKKFQKTDINQGTSEHQQFVDELKKGTPVIDNQTHTQKSNEDKQTEQTRISDEPMER